MNGRAAQVLCDTGGCSLGKGLQPRHIKIEARPVLLKIVEKLSERLNAGGQFEALGAVVGQTCRIVDFHNRDAVQALQRRRYPIAGAAEQGLNLTAGLRMIPAGRSIGCAPARRMQQGVGGSTAPTGTGVMRPRNKVPTVGERVGDALDQHVLRVGAQKHLISAGADSGPDFGGRRVIDSHEEANPVYGRWQITANPLRQDQRVVSSRCCPENAHVKRACGNALQRLRTVCDSLDARETASDR